MPRAYEEFSQCCYWWHLPLLTKCWDFPSLVFFPPPVSIPFCLFAFALLSAVLFIFHHLCSLFFDYYLNVASLLGSLFGPFRSTGKFHPFCPLGNSIHWILTVTSMLAFPSSVSQLWPSGIFFWRQQPILWLSSYQVDIQQSSSIPALTTHSWIQSHRLRA